MSECIIGHDYAVVYDLEILPEDPESLAEKHENKSLDESGKWFNDELQAGKNRPLINDFIQLARHNLVDQNAASICFLISLNKYQESLNKCKENKALEDTETVCKYSRPLMTKLD